MERLSPYARFAVCCFTVGTLVGSLAIGYLMLTLSPVPVGAKVIAFACAVSPVCIFALVTARTVPSMSWLLAPTLLIGGLAVPFDFAFACLLGFLSESGLQMTLAGLLVVSMAAIGISFGPALIRRSVNKSLRMPIQPEQGKSAGAAFP